MSNSKLSSKGVLRPRVGDYVEVRSAEEIFATLDDQGCLDGLPFMPEMLQYCGKRFQIFKSAHKTCDTIQNYRIRRVTGAVHLEGLRCDGVAHDGCQAGCLLFWKKEWLKRVRDPRTPAVTGKETNTVTRDFGKSPLGKYCNLELLQRATRITTATDSEARERYTCQATELLKASTPLKWWDPRPYMIDLFTGNVRLYDFIRYMAIASYNVIMRLHWRGRPYPYIRGLAKGKTPSERLNLQPGELVQIRSKEEIMQTINANQKNRGLWFDVEMLPFCGKTFRVLRRVEKIVDEKTGSMIRLPDGCVILEGVTCSGCLSRDRLFCPRSIYPYWHEIWLKRLDSNENKSGDVAPDHREVERPGHVNWKAAARPHQINPSSGSPAV